MNMLTLIWSGAALLVIGWIVLLAFTFIIGFNAFILNPFEL